MAPIKNIILDLGGVLLDLDYKLTSLEFQKLGVTNFDDLFTQFNANDLFEQLETGKISNQIFYDSIIQYCKAGTTQQEIEKAWNAMLLGFRTETIQTLQLLKQKYRLYLLSNTNSIHLAAFKKIFTADTGTPLLDVYFDKCYYSHEIQMRKPYVATYQYVLKDGGMQAEETLFIDDSIQNIDGAKEVGIQTHLLLPTERLEDLFNL